MKKLFVLLLLAVVCQVGMAQQIYRVTGDNVNVRKGPGTNYSRVEYNGAYGSEGYVSVNHGVLVKSKGVVKNGFMLVDEMDLFAICWETGWISTKYLVKATKCTACGGRGKFNSPCPDCHGEPYHGCSCYGTGKRHCSKCEGYGWY